MKYLITIILAFFFLSNTTDKPRILIIGDSISIGYTPFVKDALIDDAIVIHNKGNAQHTNNGIARLDSWLGDEKWDVIQFNWGLWDLCYRHENSNVQGNRDKVNGVVTLSLEQYKDNMEVLVKKLLKTDAKLIFVTTTYVPVNEAGRFSGDEAKYNKAALDIMKKYGIKVNNLHKPSIKIHKKYGKGNDDVHYTKQGYEALSISIIKQIKKIL